jgi:hypothetical protein
MVLALYMILRGMMWQQLISPLVLENIVIPNSKHANAAISTEGKLEVSD